MKKYLLIFLTLILGCILSGCIFFKILDGDGMEREIQYPIAEQECVDDNGEISTDKDGNQICIFEDGMQCPLAAIEEGDCFLIDNQGGGEWLNIVRDMCNEQGGTIEQWYEGGDIQNVCFYPDESFCYLEDLVINKCHKGDIVYNDEVLYDYPPEDKLNGKPIEEAFCDYNNGIISENEYGDKFCTFSDGGFYELRAFKELGEMPSLRGPDEPYCSVSENIVCGTDGIEYVNGCWMKSAGIEEETELAEVVDGKCIYG